VSKLETRIRHARSRKDPVVEESTRRELENILKTWREEGGGEKDKRETDECGTLVGGCSTTSNCDVEGGDLKKIEAIKISVLEIFHALFSDRRKVDDRHRHGTASSSLSDMNSPSSQIKKGKKEEETSHAVSLLRHMSKGTQDPSMFENAAALRGYARQKFTERAVLLARSLIRLKYDYQRKCSVNDGNNECDEVITQQQQQRKQDIWNNIVGNVQAVCCIGCGPGNDLVGLLCFLEHVKDSLLSDKDNMKNKNLPIVCEAYLCDYVVNAWEDILHPLSDILTSDRCHDISSSSSQRQQRLLGKAVRSRCDISLPLSHPINATLYGRVSALDFFSFSYVLTETRGLWDAFLSDLLSAARSGTVFYFAEPTPWQLHQLIELWGKETVDFMWIDSSMNFPEVAETMRREGPAVLLAVKQ